MEANQYTDKLPALFYDHQHVQTKASSLQPWELISIMSIGLDTCRVSLSSIVYELSNAQLQCFLKRFMHGLSRLTETFHGLKRIRTCCIDKYTPVTYRSISVKSEPVISKFAICPVVRHGSANSIHNPSTVTYPAMELYCILLPLTLPCCTTWQIANTLLSQKSSGSDWNNMLKFARICWLIW